MAKKSKSARRAPAKPTSSRTKPAAKAKPKSRPAAKAKATARKRSGGEPMVPARLLADRALALFDFAAGATAKYASPFTQANATAQPTPTSNHALWNLGHLAISNLWMASLIDGKPTGISDDQERLFGMQSTPSPDASAYPPFEDVKALYTRSGERLRAALRALTPAELLASCEGDPQTFCTDKLDAVLKAAWHEAWHLGQIAELRKALGLVPPKA
jgi:hypothetical protein